MWLGDKQYVCVSILGTSKDSDSDLQASELQEICCPSSMDPGWRGAEMMWIQDDAHQTVACLIGMDCARLHVEGYATPSLDLLALFPSPSSLKPLLPLGCGDGLQESRIFQVASSWKESTFFPALFASTFLYISICLSIIGFCSGRQPDLCLVTLSL